MIQAFGVELGSIAQVGTFLAVVIALIGAYVKLKDRGMTHAEVMCGQLTANVQKLREELHTCEEECRTQIKKLHEELFGLRKQHIAEQISFINILIRSVDSPELQILRQTLERVQDSLATAQMLQREERQGEAEGQTSKRSPD